MRAGFTLIELSIVLVIIGLIVGGVLVGQSLIAAAAVRAEVTQIEKFNSAVNTFFTKFRAWPGDLDPASAASFGLPAHLANPSGGNIIPNDGLIEGYDTSNHPGSPYGQGSYESGQFWTDLASQNFIEGSFSGVNGSCASDINVGNVATCMPAAKIGSNNYISAGVAPTNSNWYSIGAISGVDPGDNTAPSSPALTVTQAYSIDKKMDDGLPFTGNVVVSPGASPQGLRIAASATSCFDNGHVTNAPINYSVTYNNGMA